jgi:hypothetical protein
MHISCQFQPLPHKWKANPVPPEKEAGLEIRTVDTRSVAEKKSPIVFDDLTAVTMKNSYF